MSIFKNNWINFKPSSEYLQTIKPLTSVTKLYSFIQQFHYKWDMITLFGRKFLWDYWQSPEQTLERKMGDCEDFSTFNADVLGRIQKIDAKVVFFFGYNRKRFGWKFWMGHGVCVFPYQNKYSVFSNTQLLHGYDSYLQIGHKFYPDGLKYMKIYDWQGKIISRRIKIFGVF